MAIVAAVGLMGGAFAYFTDTVTSNTNTIQAGNIKIAMSNDGTTFYQSDGLVIGSTTNLAPGHESSPFTVYFQNQGSISGVISAVISYDRNPAKADGFARLLTVEKAYSSVLGNDPAYNVAEYWARQIAEQTGDGSWASAVANGFIVYDASAPVYGYYPTIYGLQTITLKFTNGYLGSDATIDPNQIQWEQLYIKLAANAGDDYQDTGIGLVVTATITSN